MAKFLVTTGISHHLDELIKNANERLVLISPYLQVNKNIKLALEEKNLKRVHVTIVYGKTDPQPEENKWLMSLDFVHTMFCQDLHAKCYLSETEAIITSMNLYAYSQVNNYEMGILISKDSDLDLYKAIYEEAQRLLQNSTPVRISVETVPQKPSAREDKDRTSAKEATRPVKTTKESGHCIRCNAEIKLNPSSPFCLSCYRSWKKEGDEESKEKYCHICGTSTAVTFAKPADYSCYKQHKELFELVI